jgi:hypothetical protein
VLTNGLVFVTLACAGFPYMMAVSGGYAPTGSAALEGAVVVRGLSGPPSGVRVQVAQTVHGSRRIVAELPLEMWEPTARGVGDRFVVEIDRLGWHEHGGSPGVEMGLPFWRLLGWLVAPVSDKYTVDVVGLPVVEGGPQVMWAIRDWPGQRARWVLQGG